MRKSITAVLTAGLVLGAVAVPAAQAGKKKAPKRTERVAEASYQGPAIGAVGRGVCAPGTLGCFPFGASATEKYISVQIVDTVPAPGVFASVTQDLDGDNFADTSVDICGSSAEPIEIEPGVEVTVFIWEGPGVTTDGAPCPGVATQGTITATFSNLP